ncbi:metalloregulator ArsR/SmtB family transcription factor [Svornostia abyssi]|uniref:Metalloregulator ArsR/SmtB family transcription factor n=1 Tax=Svornostia abyssi TaxID=2898438 RepID=A0ABY5PBF5_9ACTN|nr:metalloregulator ArsR/SmtB family transcription factor [Parviterribacteraceae bacterium J379]
MAPRDPFHAIADPTRRAILDQLRDGELSAGDLGAHVRISQPSLSQHLKVLREAGLVAARRDGRRRLYRLEPSALRIVREWIVEYEGYWDDRFADLPG